MVIAKRDKDRIIVALSIADSSIDMTDRDLTLDDNIPLHKVRGEKDCYICARACSLDFDLLKFNDKIFRGIEDGMSISNSVIPKMKSLFDSYPGYSSSKWVGVLVIIKGLKMYIIDADFCVNEEDTEVCCCRSYIPQGAFHALRSSGLSAKECILEAIACCDKMQEDLYPFVLFDTKTKSKTIVNK